MKNREPAEEKCEADGLKSYIHSLYIKVEYHRSLEYCLKWDSPMYPRRSSRLSKASKKSPERNPSSDEEVIQRRPRGRRQTTGKSRKSRSGDGMVNADQRKRDVIDIINSTHGAERLAKEDKEKSVEVADRGVDESDEDWCSVTSSVTSGPSLSYHARPTQDRCSVCQKLYQKARRMKAPLKNKPLDHDPQSLTCDQWVLIKTWRPKKVFYARGNLLIHLNLVKKRLTGTKALQQHEQYVGQPSACSRPHIFLQRNLRRCVNVPVRQERKKNKRRKRTRDDYQGSRVAKQQRLHRNTHDQHISSAADNSRHPTSAHSSASGFEDCSDVEISNQTCSDVAVEVNPCSVTLETTRSRELPAKQVSPKSKKGFRDLLAQLRSNSSMIVRETR